MRDGAREQLLARWHEALERARDWATETGEAQD
jgi:hypothetical protein